MHYLNYLFFFQNNHVSDCGQSNNDLTTMNSRERLEGPGIDAIKFKVSS